MASLPLHRNRDFLLLWSGQAISALGSQISIVAYPLLVLAVTGSRGKAGVVGFAVYLPISVLALPAGVVADKVNRKYLMVGCDGVRAVALASRTPTSRTVRRMESTARALRCLNARHSSGIKPRTVAGCAYPMTGSVRSSWSSDRALCISPVISS